MFDFLEPVVSALHTYTGALVWIFSLCTAMSAGVTELVIRTERAQRKAAGRTKAWWWNTAMRGVSTAVGLGFAPVARLVLLEIPRAAPEPGAEIVPLEQLVPSPFMACLVGFLTGFFLTLSVWGFKKLIERFSAEAAEKIPNIGGETISVDLTPADRAALEAKEAEDKGGKPE